MLTTSPSEVLRGRYELVELIAVGGAGEVWRGRDSVLDRPVAIKLLRPEYADDAATRDRFRDEARHAAGLAHPHVAQVYDFDEGAAGQPGRPFIVLECVDGQPLSQALARRGPLSPQQTWAVLAQTASALAAAHSIGLVHRDVKPANLLVRPDGWVKVTDFGIARAVNAAPLTQTGFILGTVPYLSPEQAAGASATPASDLYALGVIGYECLTGRRPFTGDPMAVLTAHREQPPPPLPDSTPAALRDLITSLLAKDPERRPAAAEVVAHEGATGDPADLAGLATSADEAAAAGPLRGRAETGPATRTLSTHSGNVGGAPTSALPTSPGHRSPLAGALSRPRALAIAMTLAVIVASAAFALLVARGGPTQRPSGTAAGRGDTAPIAVRGVSLFGPGGSAADHPEEAPLAADGNVTTAWYTQHYATAAFGGLHPGAGLVFDLGTPERVRSLALRVATPGTAIRVYAGNDPAALLGAGAVATTDTAGSLTRLAPSDSAPERYWLIWFTRLAPNDGAFRAGLAEAVFQR